MALEQSGSFFCQTCLEYQPTSEQSPDIRYCKGGCDFLLKEAAIIREHGVTKRANWMPIKTLQKGKKVVEDISVQMSTLEDENITVDISSPTVASGATKKRRRKYKQLPEGFIKQLATEGLGSKAITTRLRKERGVTVSYKTIQRVLSGERKRDIEIDTLPVLDS